MGVKQRSMTRLKNHLSPRLPKLLLAHVANSHFPPSHQHFLHSGPHLPQCVTSGSSTEPPLVDVSMLGAATVARGARGFFSNAAVKAAPSMLTLHAFASVGTVMRCLLYTAAPMLKRQAASPRLRSDHVVNIPK